MRGEGLSASGFVAIYIFDYNYVHWTCNLDRPKYIVLKGQCSEGQCSCCFGRHLCCIDVSQDSRCSMLGILVTEPENYFLRATTHPKGPVTYRDSTQLNN